METLVHETKCSYKTGDTAIPKHVHSQKIHLVRKKNAL